jgi:hypothetical protein
VRYKPQQINVNIILSIVTLQHTNSGVPRLTVQRHVLQRWSGGIETYFNKAQDLSIFSYWLVMTNNDPIYRVTNLVQ